eukprot:800-Heterococcus_DN1.PRE.2
MEDASLCIYTRHVWLLYQLFVFVAVHCSEHYCSNSDLEIITSKNNKNAAENRVVVDRKAYLKHKYCEVMEY